MTLRRLLSLFALFTLISGASAQDVHYTLHNMSPLTLNPANQGAFYGSIRVSGIVRAQWYGVAGPKTPSIGIDAPVIRGLRKQDWIGAGFNMVYDRSGSGDLGNIVRSTTAFGASYHFAFDKKQETVLTLGAQYGGTRISYIAPDGQLRQGRTTDTDLGGGGSTTGEIIGGVGGASAPGNRNDNPNDNYSDINVGLMLRTLLDKKDKNTLEVGVAMMRLTNDDFRAFTSRDTMGTVVGPAFGSNSVESREAKRTLHAHATLDYKMTDKIRFMPTLFYQNSANNSSLSLQAWAGYSLKNDMLFKFGLGYRTGDAGKILVGIEKDRLQVAASYDVVLSQLAGFNAGSPNAFELAANYIFNIYKKPVVNPELLCPKI